MSRTLLPMLLSLSFAGVLLFACGEPQVTATPDTGAPLPGTDSGTLPLDASVAEPPDAATPEPLDATLPEPPDASLPPDAGNPGTPCTTHADCADQQWCNWEGYCEGCPPVEEPVCTDQPWINEAPFGNGCIRKQCCYSGQDPNPRDGWCVDVPLIDLANCPYTRVFECWIRLVNGNFDPLTEPFTTPLDFYERTSFALRNDGRATLHFDELGLTAGSSPDLSISGYSVMPDDPAEPWQPMSGPLPTELGAGKVIVIQLRYAPQGTLERDLGEFAISTDAVNNEDRWILPVVADSWNTACTTSTVRDTCVVGQRCTEELPEYGPLCEDCPMVQDPLCNNGRTVCYDPPGAYLCAAYTCECLPGDAYFEEGFTYEDGSKGPACVPVKDCDSDCRECLELCTQYPFGGPDGTCPLEKVERSCIDDL